MPSLASTTTKKQDTPDQGSSIPIITGHITSKTNKCAEVITSDLGSPTDIIMDRLTGETMECYVDFISVDDAQAVIDAKRRTGNIHGLRDRVATVVDMSWQDNLLRRTFMSLVVNSADSLYYI